MSARLRDCEVNRGLASAAARHSVRINATRSMRVNASRRGKAGRGSCIVTEWDYVTIRLCDSRHLADRPEPKRRTPKAGTPFLLNESDAIETGARRDEQVDQMRCGSSRPAGGDVAGKIVPGRCQ